MTDVVDHLKIMNNALARMGAGAIIGEDDDSELAAQVAAVYYDRVDALLSMHAWSFAAKTYKLDAVAKIADNDFVAADDRFMTGYGHGFSLPGTRLGDPRRMLTNPRCPDDPLRDFIIEAGRVYCDHEDLWAIVTVRADPVVWHPVFRLAVTTSVAAELCVPVSHDANLAQTLRTEAEGRPEEQGRGGLIGRAMGIDASTSRARSPLHSDPLTSARFR